MVKKNINSKFIQMLDIGSRYGIHPTWKNFNGDINFYLVEADKNEAQRLKTKYKNYKNIFSYFSVLGKDKGLETFNILNNVAMSGLVKRKSISPLFWGERKEQSKLQKKISVKTISLNSFLLKNKIKPDFIKLDVEGYETSILKNGNVIFNTLLGARSEVSFANIFQHKSEVGGNFSSIHEIFTNQNFILLNLDYDGKGDYFSRFLKSNSKYGALQSTDAVWIKNPKFIVKYFDENNIIKTVIFCILNNAMDIALWILDNTYSKFRSFKKTKNSKNFKFIMNSLCKYFYTLKWIPGQKIKEHKLFFEKIFQTGYPEMNEYNESKTYNPY